MSTQLAEAFHPGEFLAEELEERQWTLAEFAQNIDQSTPWVSEIISGNRDISRQTATEFGRAFGQSEQYWLNLQNEFTQRTTP